MQHERDAQKAAEAEQQLALEKLAAAKAQRESAAAAEAEAEAVTVAESAAAEAAAVAEAAAAEAAVEEAAAAVKAAFEAKIEAATEQQLHRYNKLSLGGTIPFEGMQLDSNPNSKTVVRHAPIYGCSLEDACDNSDPASMLQLRLTSCCARRLLLSSVVIRLSFVVICCHRCHLFPSLVIRCHSLTFFAICCHPLLSRAGTFPSAGTLCMDREIRLQRRWQPLRARNISVPSLLALTLSDCPSLSLIAITLSMPTRIAHLLVFFV